MKIAFMLSEHMLASSITLPSEMLHAAADHARARHRRQPLEIDYIAQQPRQRIKTRCGIMLQATTTLDTGTLYDLVFLPALWRNPPLAVKQNPDFLPWLRQQSAAGAMIGAVGTGVCHLAASGLLDERPATTHWFYLDRFSALYPQVDLKRQYFITRADNLYCAASINALADLTVHFIRQLYGSATAGHIERHFSHEARNSYENITYRENASENHHDEDIIQIQLWLHQHYAQPIQFTDIAKKFGMSVRNFNRRFVSATNKKPLQYLQSLRMDEGRDLLKNSNLSISEAAEKVGYQDKGYFTSLFKKTFNTTPQEYRKSIRSKLFTV